MSDDRVHPDGDVTLEEQGAGLLIGLNRPQKLNALTARMIRQLSDAYADHDRDERYRCAVLLEVALNGDVIVAAKGTNLGHPEVLRGLFAFGGGAIRWVERCGWGNAQWYLLTGDTLDAEEARRIGLVQDIVELDQVMPHAVALARKDRGRRAARSASLACRIPSRTRIGSLGGRCRVAADAPVPD